MSETIESFTPTTEQFADFGRMLWEVFNSMRDVAKEVDDPLSELPNSEMADAYIAVWRRLKAELSAAESRAAAAEAECERLKVALEMTCESYNKLAHNAMDAWCPPPEAPKPEPPLDSMAYTDNVG